MNDTGKAGPHKDGATADDSTKQFLKRKMLEFVAFRRALTEESDRGCALFAAAYLDKALSDLLYLSLVENGRKIEADLFEGNAPLSTFSARIKMAFYLGRISASCRSELETIRKIRNAFAHDARLVSFETQSMADRCRNLGYSYHQKDSRPRDHFPASCSRLLGILQKTALNSVAPVVKPDDRPTEEQKAKARESAEEVAKEAEEAAAKEAHKKPAGPGPGKGGSSGDAA